MGFFRRWRRRQKRTVPVTPDEIDKSTPDKIDVDISLPPVTDLDKSATMPIKEQREEMAVNPMAAPIQPKPDVPVLPPLPPAPPLPIPAATYQSPDNDYHLPTALHELIKEAKVADESRFYAPELIALSLQERFITPTKALALARHQPNPVQRGQALVALALLPEPITERDAWRGLWHEVQTVATTITDVSERAQLLAAVPTGRTEAVILAQSLRDAATQLDTLIAIEAWPEALTAVGAMNSEWEKANALIRLAPRLPASLLPRAVAVAQAMTEYETHCAQALSALIPHLPDSELAKLRQWIAGVEKGWLIVIVGSYLWPTVAAAERTAWLHRLRQAAGKEQFANKEIEVWMALLPHLPTDEQAAIWREMLEVARSIDQPTFRADALGTVALAGSREQREAVLAEAEATMRQITAYLNHDRYWGEWGQRLCRRGDAASVLAGLTLFQKLESAYSCSSRLEQVATTLSVLPPPTLVTQCQQLLPGQLLRSLFWQRSLAHWSEAHQLAVWQDVMAMTDDGAKRLGLITLATLLPTRRREMVRTALATLSKRPSQSSMPLVLAAIAQQLPSERARLLGEAMVVVSKWDAATQLHCLTGMVQRLGDDAPSDLVTQTEAVIEQIPDEYQQAVAWETLFLHGPSSQRARWRRLAMTATFAISVEAYRRMRLFTLLAALPDPELVAVWPRALGALSDNDLPYLLKCLQTPLSPDLVDALLTRLSTLQSHQGHLVAEVVALLAPTLSVAQLEVVAAMVASLRLPSHNILAEAALASRRPMPERAMLLKDLLVQARALAVATSRVTTLIGLSCYLQDAEKTAVLREAMQSIYMIEEAGQRGHYWLRLAAQTTPDLLADVVYGINQIGDERLRAQALTDLAPQLTRDSVGVLLPFVAEMGKGDGYQLLLEALIPLLPSALLPDALQLIRARAHEPLLATPLKRLLARWDEMVMLAGINGRVEMVTTLQAFAQNGTVFLWPAFIAFIPLLAEEGGERLLKTLARQVRRG